MFELTLALSVAGALISVLTAGCVNVHIKDPNDAKLFGRVHLYLIGIIGYGIIAIAAINPLAFKIVAVGTGLFTIYLIIKAIKIRLGCPVCPLVWVVNAGIVVIAFLR